MNRRGKNITEMPSIKSLIFQCTKKKDRSTFVLSSKNNVHRRTLDKTTGGEVGVHPVAVAGLRSNIELSGIPGALINLATLSLYREPIVYELIFQAS